MRKFLRATSFISMTAGLVSTAILSFIYLEDVISILKSLKKKRSNQQDFDLH